MADTLDLTPAARRMAAVVAGVRDDALTAPTPCSQYTVGDLLDHIGGLTVAFTRAAKKELGESGNPPPGRAELLGDDWRTRIPADLDALAAAWRDSDAWQGMTRAGGIDMPGEIAGVVAVDELLVHGWDLAKASGQDFDADDATADAALGFYAMFGDGDRGDAFGAANPQPATASKLDQVIGLSGRDPGWSPPA
jgi:uncharacterized protein (TIGR03086 family)